MPLLKEYKHRNMQSFIGSIICMHFNSGSKFLGCLRVYIGRAAYNSITNWAGVYGNQRPFKQSMAIDPCRKELRFQVRPDNVNDG